MVGALTKRNTISLFADRKWFGDGVADRHRFAYVHKSTFLNASPVTLHRMRKELVGITPTKKDISRKWFMFWLIGKCEIDANGHFFYSRNHWYLSSVKIL